MAAFGGARGAGSKAPEKGVFPLDHFNECKELCRKYLECLDEYDQDATKCEGMAHAYLTCRMNRELMVKQDLSELGLRPVPHVSEAEGEKKQ